MSTRGKEWETEETPSHRWVCRDGHGPHGALLDEAGRDRARQRMAAIAEQKSREDHGRDWMADEPR